jgi:hypothetical protein
MSKYTLHMIITGVVIFSALHYGVMALGYNLAEYLSLVFFRVFRKRVAIDTGIYVVFAACALYLALQRDTWLPFLGETVMPSALVPLKTNVGDTVVDVRVSPEAKVVYWSAKPKDEVTSKPKDEVKQGTSNPEVEQAYDDYSNSGVTQANIDGIAKLAFNKGTDYVVPGGKTIKSHVHYREMDLKYGMMGPVQTVYV